MATINAATCRNSIECQQSSIDCKWPRVATQQQWWPTHIGSKWFSVHNFTRAMRKFFHSNSSHWTYCFFYAHTIARRSELIGCRSIIVYFTIFFFLFFLFEIQAHSASARWYCDWKGSVERGRVSDRSQPQNIRPSEYCKRNNTAENVQSGTQNDIELMREDSSKKKRNNTTCGLQIIMH